MDRIEEKPKFAFLGNSHMAFWALDIYFPQWECLNYGAPGEGLAYVESFAVDTSDCQVVVQFGTNDIYQLNDENVDGYVRSDLVKLDILINKEEVDALSFIVHADTAYERGRKMCEKLKEEM